jgi:hypothetical protein
LRACAVRLALHSLTWLVFRWLCLGRFLWPHRCRWVLLWLGRFLWVRRCRWVLLWLRRFRWVLLWLRRFRWVLRSLTWPVAMAVRGSRLVRCRMERLRPVSQFCLALWLTGRAEADRSPTVRRQVTTGRRVKP